MKKQREKKAKLNIVSSLTSQVLSIVCGLIVPHVMLEAFGSEAYGATSSITQFLAYITLLEGGIGGVARAVLYKPLAQKDTAVISAIMGEIKRFFRVVAWIFAAYVLILACGFRAISRVSCMDWLFTFFLVIVISISTFGQYFIGISNSILLQADQKTYITNWVSIGATMINAVSTIVLIQLGYSLITVKLASSCIFFMRPVVLWLYVKKYYPISARSTDAPRNYLTQKWSGLGQHIAYFLHTNTDIAVLTILMDLRTVAVYSVYNMIISHMQSFASAFCSGMESVFGDMLARKEEQKLHDTFSTYETILSVVSVVLFSATAVLIMPFIKLYTLGINDTNYMQPAVAFIMILTALSYCLRMPYHSLVIAAGHFKQTSAAAYGEALINITLSFILVLKYGLLGVALATLAATWFRFLYCVIYLSRNITYRKIKLFIKRFGINIVSFLCNYIMGNAIISSLEINGYFLWVVCGAGTVVAMGALTAGLNFMFFFKDCCLLLKKIFK